MTIEVGPELEPAQVRDRYRGALLGLAAGNALGLEVEGWSRASIAARGGVHEVDPRQASRPWDDDLAQAVELAEVILEHDSVNGAAFARTLVRWRRENGSGIGILTNEVIDELERGTLDAARVVWERSGRNSAGNGAVMRCAPVAMRWRTPPRIIVEARASALVTHADPRCEWSTVATCLLISPALAGRIIDPVTLAQLLEEMGAPPVVSDAPRATMHASLEDLSLDDGAMGYTLKALQVAIWCVLQPPSFEQVLVEIVNAGGDTDTNGAVAGALMGARVGAAGVPWTDRLREPERLIGIADRLFERATA